MTLNANRFYFCSFLVQDADAEIEERDKMIMERNDDGTAVETAMAEKYQLLEETRKKFSSINEQLEAIDIGALTDQLASAKIRDVELSNEIRGLECKQQYVKNIARDSDDQKVAYEAEVKTLQGEAQEESQLNLVQDQRLASEQNVVESFIKQRIETQSARVMDGNLNIARQLQAQLKIYNDTDKFIKEIDGQANQVTEKIQSLMQSDIGIHEVIRQLEMQLNLTPAENVENQMQKKSLVAQIESTKIQVQQVNKEMQKTIKSYQKKLKKFHRRQSMIDILKDSSAEKAGDEFDSSFRSDVSVAEILTMEKVYMGDLKSSKK